MPVRPFPWGELPRAPRTPSHPLGAARALLEDGALAGAAIEALRRLLSVPIDVSVDAIGAAASPTLATHAVAIRLSAGDAWVDLDVEPTLARTVVALATRRAVAPVPVLDPPSRGVIGAFAAVLAAAVRRAGVPVVVQLPGDEASPAAHAEAVVVVGASVCVQEQWTHVRAVFPGRLLAGVSPRLRPGKLRAQGDLPLALPVIACVTSVAAIELATLGDGDALMLGDAWTLGRAGGPPVGRVWLSAPASERGLVADLEASGDLVLRDGVEELSWSPMVEDTKNDAVLAEAVGEVPVVVRVELGAARMKAREWSALQPGDVVALGVKVGGPVTLRVSGLAVAEGELVDVEGEVGVRIRRRFTGEAR